MTIRRRAFLLLLAGAALPAMSDVARAQDYPTRPIRLVVGFAAGGTQDVIARLIGQALSERLGQQIVIENRAGASSNIAAEAVIRSTPDGYTLFMVGPNNAINATLYDKLPFDFVRDTAAVAGIMRVPNVMEVHPSVPAKSVPEFIAYAKANPGKINMVSGGTGTSVHVSGELFKLMTGVNMVHVPYRGAGPALADLIAGQVQVMFDNLPSSIGHIRSGKLRALAVTTAKPSEALPGIPAVAEFVPGYEASAFFGISAPKPRRPPSSAGSMPRSTLFLPMPRLGHASPTSAARRSRARRPISASWSPTKPKSGPRLSSSRVPSRTDLKGLPLRIVRRVT